MVLLKKRRTMRPTDCFRLFVLCLWLLVGDVNCEKSQKGYILRAQAGQASLGVLNDNGDHRRWSEPLGFRNPVNPAEDKFTSGAKSSEIPSPHPGPQNANAPKSQAKYFKPDFNSASVTQGQSAVHSGSKTLAGCKKIHKGNSIFSSSVHRGRVKSTGGFLPVQVNKAPLGFGTNDRRILMYLVNSAASPHIQAIKSRSHSAHVSPSSINRDRTQLMQKALKPTDGRTHVVMNGPVGSPAGKVDTKISLVWSPRVYSGDVMSEGKGYAQSRRLRPGFNKTQAQASPVKPNLGAYIHDSTGLGFGLSAAREGQLSLDDNFRGKQPSSRHPPLPERAMIPVKGKFKPFQRLPAKDDLAAKRNSSEGEIIRIQTLPTDLNSTIVTASVIPPVAGDVSTESASPVQAQDDEVVSEAPNHEDQSEGSGEVGVSSEQNEAFTIFLQTSEGSGDGIFLSSLELDQPRV